VLMRDALTVPAIAPTLARKPAASVSDGTKDTIALTVRLDPERCRQLVADAASLVPHKTHQDILVDALDAYLDEVAA
jgi:hypothetical protein